MNANDRQVGGDHYRRRTGVMQHWDYAWEKGFDPFQYQITKYVERWRDKNGVQDLKKALHFLEKYIELAESDDAKAQKLMEEMQEVRERVPTKKHLTKKNFYAGKDESIAAHTDGEDKRASASGRASGMVQNESNTPKSIPAKSTACRWCGKIHGDKFSVHAIGCPGIGEEESQNADGARVLPVRPTAPAPPPHRTRPG